MVASTDFARRAPGSATRSAKGATMTQKTIVCGTCGGTHDGFPTDQAWILPDDVWAIPEPERSKVAKFDADLCQMGKRVFYRDDGFRLNVFAGG